jgi:hypothetical protein
MVVVAQLVRALDCGSRGRRFEPGLPPKKKPALCRFFLCYGVTMRSSPYTGGELVVNSSYFLSESLLAPELSSLSATILFS